ncbi:hypothetical protein CONPUDRAFT_125025 [Coniophora puteana RWD-64-598 SS2]|uniref:Phosphatidylglycerol lysyltransferase C-terminal domain-containing protein n=1 Tax=Coniophora puteana (strain RWD-64-598) TaxID=741705 RepID=A0A5M3MNJ3_CONPW|nr:uncharacterized protein CONPUDRAFT_125025 [Coniophora puteana RWD-64-598 SS2]EIW80295.1 hypothetical protein CONPUDRAFT_125025 [Coniophora puteana RWD-64-598 SS2]
MDGAELADIVAKHGHSSATAWLETDHYRIWRPSASEPIKQSSFPPVQGYLEANNYVFAWGNPIVSDVAALKPTLEAFIAWVTSRNSKPVFSCVNSEVESILASMGWATVSCINEDVVDPEHVYELTHEEAVTSDDGNAGMVKDMKKNLRRADKADLKVEEITGDAWTDDVKKEIDDGVAAWKKSRSGIQLAATDFLPWLDFEHRRYWLARHEGKAVGIIIISPVRDQYVIKNAVHFPKAPKGTSEQLIHQALTDLRNERSDGEDHPSVGDISVTFSISAAGDLKPTKNISGWRFTWLNKTYSNVSSSAGLLNRGDFRSKFDSKREPMFVCYSSEDGFGLDGIETLVKLLRR